ncbi:MAG: hypothetical protein ACUZ8H_16060 [Candidatus Anammoxibacter sp.]
MKKIITILLTFIAFSITSQITISDEGNWIKFVGGTKDVAITKPYNIYTQGNGLLIFKSSISTHKVFYSDVTAPSLGSKELLRDSVMSWISEPKVTTDYLFEIAKGSISNHSTFHRFGLNEAVGTDFEDVWTVSANIVYLTSASTLIVTSNNAQDAIAGTGAQKVTLVMLDANFIEFTEVLNLAASSTVTTTGSALRLVRAYVSQWGSGKENVAVLDITATTGGSTQGEIVVGENQTLMSHYTVPAGKTAYIFNFVPSVGKIDDAQCQLLRKDATVTNSGFIMVQRFPVYQNSYQKDLRIPLKFVEKTDIVVRAKSIVGGIQVGASFDMVIVNN